MVIGGVVVLVEEDSVDIEIARHHALDGVDRGVPVLTPTLTLDEIPEMTKGGQL